MESLSKNIYHPKECMKHMIVECHPALLEAWYSADIKREVTGAGAKVVARDTVCDPGLVFWLRNMPPPGSGPRPLSSFEQLCSKALYVMLAAEAAPLVAARKLSQHVLDTKEKAGTSITVVIVLAKDYFKSKGRKTQSSMSKKITEIELEMALTDLLVSVGCDSVVVNTANELALLIMQQTKAIAEAPYKSAKRKVDDEAEFYMRGANNACIAMDLDSESRPRLWQQMLAVLPQSSLEIARVLCSKYCTPQSLVQACESRDAVQEIADIGVVRSIMPRARNRRIGPEFARRLHTLFNSDDGEEVLN